MFRRKEEDGPVLRSVPGRVIQTLSGISITKQFAILISILLLVTAVGCNKSGVLGIEVQPESDIIGGMYSDTTTLVSYTIRADSLISNEPILGMLGSYIDPVFGLSTASFYVKFSMPSSNIDFGSGFTPDSLVMTFGYTGYYGEEPLPQTLSVFQIASTSVLDRESTYYSSSSIPTDPFELGGAVINPADEDETVSFKLSDPIFTSADYEFADNAVFQDFIRGFHILVDSTDPGGMLYLDVNSSATKLTLYYNDSASYDFEIDSESAWFNKFDHNYSGTDVETQLLNPSLGEQLVYVQPNEGTMVKIEMPYITDWNSIAVNKAELVLSVYDDGSLGTYDVPENLFILGAGENVVITDQNEGATHFGGTYDAATRTYKFNIARYVHELLYEGRANDGIHLIVPNNLLPSGSVVSANRVILGGPGHGQLGMKLNLIYTEY